MWVPQLPERLLWDHNTYYARWLLRLLPARVPTALDVGCGAGWLATALAGRADRVDAVDRSAAMIDMARARCPAGVNWVLGDVLADDLALADGYDLVTAVTCLHHIPLRPALRRLAGLVRRAGKPYAPGMPMREATDTLAVISGAAAEIMPGALVRRRLFWRYTLLWHRPA